MTDFGGIFDPEAIAELVKAVRAKKGVAPVSGEEPPVVASSSITLETFRSLPVQSLRTPPTEETASKPANLVPAESREDNAVDVDPTELPLEGALSKPVDPIPAESPEDEAVDGGPAELSVEGPVSEPDDPIPTESAMAPAGNPTYGLPVTLTPDQAADFMGLERKTVYRGLKTGEIPGRRVGNRWVILRDALLSWLRCTSQQRGSPQKRK